VDLREIVWGDVDWIHVTQDRNQWRVLTNTCSAFGFHKRREFFWNSWVAVSFLRKGMLQQRHIQLQVRCVQ